MEMLTSFKLGKLSVIPAEMARFPAGVAHEFANVLNAITMNAEITKMLMERKQAINIDETLERLLGDCQRANNLIQDLYRYAGEIQAYQFEETLSSSLVEKATLKVIEETACNSDFIFIEQTMFNAPIFGARYILERALANILRNAFERGVAQIKITTAITNTEVEINCKDNGSSIKDESFSSISAFPSSVKRTQGKNDRSMSFAYSAAKGHGGQLRMKNMPEAEKGLMVTLILPRADV